MPPTAATVMGYPGQPSGGDWDELRALEQEIVSGVGLDPTGSWRDLLLRIAPTVGISPADAAADIATVEGASSFVLEARRRIREGSRRLGDALVRAEELREQGRLDEARVVLETLVADESVPLYREIATNELIR